MYSWGWQPYESVAERKKKAEAIIAKKIKRGENIIPIRIEGRTIARSFWGKAWCKHLESFSDYESRLPRGRSYVRHGSVIHLAITKGKINAQVQGSSLYKITIEIAPATNKTWQAILKKCTGEIASIVELLQGKFSDAVMTTMTDKHNGLFPKPSEISLKCSCLDLAIMCKHVAAVLYGAGARLDHEPKLLFILRNVDYMELLETAANTSILSKSKISKTIDNQDLSTLFGIDIDISAPKNSKAIKKRKSESRKPTRKQVVLHK